MYKLPPAIMTPDNWVMLRVQSPDKVSTHILSGYSGGYTYGESWRLSCPIVLQAHLPGGLEATTESGSIYNLPQSKLGMTPYMQDVLASLRVNSFPKSWVVDVVETLSQESE